jgi:hypothetical protein
MTISLVSLALLNSKTIFDDPHLLRALRRRTFAMSMSSFHSKSYDIFDRGGNQCNSAMSRGIARKLDDCVRMWIYCQKDRACTTMCESGR